MNTITTTEARTGLSRTLARFRTEGQSAEPVVFGDHRRPEGVVLPYSLYQRLEALIEQTRFADSQTLQDQIWAVNQDPSIAVQIDRRS